MLPWFDSWFCAGEPDQECHGWNPDDVSTVTGFLLNSPSCFWRSKFFNKKFISRCYSHWYFDLISFSISNISHTGGPVIPSVSKLIASFGHGFATYIVIVDCITWKHQMLLQSAWKSTDLLRAYPLQGDPICHPDTLQRSEIEHCDSKCTG